MQLEVFKLHWKALNVDKNSYGTSMMPPRFAEIKISDDTIKKIQIGIAWFASLAYKIAALNPTG